MLVKTEVVEALRSLRKDQVVITTMGFVRPWGDASQHPFDFASADSAMGHASDLALGIALAQPGRSVWCLNGDGSMLMNLGNLVTIGSLNPKNYYLFVIENGTYEITGNQSVPGLGQLDLVTFAQAAGIRNAISISEADQLTAALPGVLGQPGPGFIRLKVEPGNEGPLSRGPQVVERYLKDSLERSAWKLRIALCS